MGHHVVPSQHTPGNPQAGKKLPAWQTAKHVGKHRACPQPAPGAPAARHAPWQPGATRTGPLRSAARHGAAQRLPAGALEQHRQSDVGHPLAVVEAQAAQARRQRRQPVQRRVPQAAAIAELQAGEGAEAAAERGAGVLAHHAGAAQVQGLEEGEIRQAAQALVAHPPSQPAHARRMGSRERQLRRRGEAQPGIPTP